MTATDDEQARAQTNNVRIRHWAAPTRLIAAMIPLSGSPPRVMAGAGQPPTSVASGEDVGARTMSGHDTGGDNSTLNPGTPTHTVTGVEFARTKLDAAGRLTRTGETFMLEADMVLKAIGQSFVSDPVGEALALHDGRIVVDADRRTSLPGVHAGGDCVPGADLTVSAVQDGKRAAAAIHRQLCG
jgi:hypothetical protein